MTAGDELSERYRAILDARLMEFFLTRLDNQDDDPAAEWDAFVAYREVVRGEVEELERAAQTLVRGMSPEDAERVIAPAGRWWRTCVSGSRSRGGTRRRSGCWRP